MIAWALDAETHDLHLEADGNLAMVTDANTVGQHAKQRLKFFEGEWFLNTRVGVPWMRYIFPKPPSMAIAEGIIMSEIVRTPGVVEIIDFLMIYDAGMRGIEVLRAEITTIYDEPVEINV